jgi:hypothetical protein
MMSRNLTIVLTVLAAFLIVVLVVAFILVLPEVTGGQTTASVQNTATSAVEEESEEIAVEPSETAVPTQLPAPVVEVLATDTPLPTDTPTDTPEPTATPEETDTPEPTATSTPVPPAPVIVLPTSTPVPPTSPPPPTAVPVNTHGLQGTHFAVQSRSNYTVNGEIWYEFTVQNNSGGPVPFQALGALPKKNGADRGDLFKLSWGGNDDVIHPGGLTAEDWIKLPETGNYTLRLVICFEALSACQNGSSPWVTLSQEVPVTIN